MKHVDLDAKLLRDNNIMDYSLLLAIERNPDYRDGGSTIKGHGMSEFIVDDISPEQRKKH
jgi:hypothetical protein